MEEIISLSQHVEWIISVSLFSFSTIKNLSPISVEYGPFSICFFETCKESFTNSVYVVTINCSSNFEIVITEDDVVIVGWEKDSSVLFSDDPEVEGISGEAEVDPRSGDGEVETGDGVDGEDSFLWNLEPVIVWVLYFECKIVEGHAVEAELQSLDDGTGWFQIVVVWTCVGQSQGDGWRVGSVSGDLVLRLGCSQGEE